MSIAPEAEAPAKPKPKRKTTPKAKKVRDVNGLIVGKDYVYDDFGFVDWKAMIDSQHVFLRDEFLLEKGIKIEDLSDEEIEEKKGEASDEELLIKLAGFKDLARLRGYTKTHYKFTEHQGAVTVESFIEWTPNFETGMLPVSTSAIASANKDNTQGKFSSYLAAIAENRAFVRNVKNFLGIHVIGESELKDRAGYDVEAEHVSTGESTGVGPQAALQKVMEVKSISFDKLKERLAELEWEGIDEWEGIEDIPPEEAVAILKKFQTAEA